MDEPLDPMNGMYNAQSENGISSDSRLVPPDDLSRLSSIASKLGTAPNAPSFEMSDGDNSAESIVAAKSGVGLVPAPTFPMDVANVLLDRWERVRFIGENSVTRSINWRDDWFDHVGSHYHLTTKTSIENSLWRALSGAQYTTKDDDGNVKFIAWNPTEKKVKDVLRAIKVITAVEDEADSNSWLKFPDDPLITAHTEESIDIKPVACKNVLVDVVNNNAFKHDERYLNLYSLPFEYDADAECPEWCKFLESIFPGDEESKDLLAEWFGYVLSGRTNMQKMMILKGASRSGKGTIARILSALLGDNVASPFLEDFVGSGFNLASFLGKPLATVGDARNALKPSDMQSAISKMLSITGEDSVKIERKYKEAWNGKLPTRLMLLSNEHLSFKDSSGAIVGRALMLIFKISFENREDRGLETRLRAELAGILNWAIRGYQRFIKTGVFTEPKSTMSDRLELSTAASPVGAWLQVTCARGDASDLVMSSHMYDRFVEWHEQNDVTGEPVHKNRMLQQIKTIAEWSSVGKKPNVPCHCQMCNGKRSMAWTGIKYLGDEREA